MQDCGKCTLCCKLPKIPTVNSPVDTYCKYCEPQVGCKIYNVRPKECMQFWCMWAQMDNAGIELRPDKCRTVFEKVSNDIVIGRIEQGKQANSFVKGQLRAFNNQGFSVVMFQGKTNRLFLSKKHTSSYVRGVINDGS